MTSRGLCATAFCAKTSSDRLQHGQSYPWPPSRKGDHGVCRRASPKVRAFVGHPRERLALHGAQPAESRRTGRGPTREVRRAPLRDERRRSMRGGRPRSRAAPIGDPAARWLDGSTARSARPTCRSSMCGWAGPSTHRYADAPSRRRAVRKHRGRQGPAGRWVPLDGSGPAIAYETLFKRLPADAC